MQPLAIDLRLLTEAGAPGLRLLPGRGLMARVVQADGSGRGLLNIAGALIEAELPRQVRAGEQLRLVVRQLSEQRVVLELPSGQDAPPAAAPAPPIPLPGGGSLRVVDEEPGSDAGGGEPETGTSRLTLRYDAPALGRLDLRFELAPGGLRLSVATAPGPALAAGQAGAEELQGALTEALERPVSVTVAPRREPLDVYA